jgi:hypothetical protein
MPTWIRHIHGLFTKKFSQTRRVPSIKIKALRVRKAWIQEGQYRPNLRILISLVIAWYFIQISIFTIRVLKARKYVSIESHSFKVFSVKKQISIKMKIYKSLIEPVIIFWSLKLSYFWNIWISVGWFLRIVDVSILRGNIFSL